MGKEVVKFPLKFLVLGVLIGSLWFFYNNYGYSQSAQPPRMVVAQQPGSPLLILITYLDSSDPLQPRYGYTVTNVSDKPIRTYTIQESAGFGAGNPIISTQLTNSPAVKLFLKPHELSQSEGGRGRIYQSPPDKVELSVDFVEFSDGSRWGDDTSKSGEILDGERAGGKAAIKRYGEILANEGINGLEKALENPNLIQPENPKSAYWSQGFNSGVNFMKHRLRKAQKKGGQNEVKLELEKPFDSTEGRQEP